MASAPSQPCSSPPNVSRQPSSQPVPRSGECGQRSPIRARVQVRPVGGVQRSRAADYAATRAADTRADRPGVCARMGAVKRVVIIGGGPGGYEAALVAAQLGAEVTVVDTDGLGGSAVLTDCVPSKTLIATAELMTDMAERRRARRQLRGRRRRRGARGRGRPRPGQRPGEAARAGAVRRHRAAGSSARACGCCVGRGRLDGPQRVVVELGRRRRRRRSRPTPCCVATGAAPRTLPTARSPTASGSSPGSRSTTSTRCPSRADRGRLRRHRRRVRQRLQRARRRRRRWSPAATGCCPARTPTPPRCSRTSSTRRGMTVLSQVADGVGDPRRRRR